MVEEVKELKTDSQRSTLPSRNLGDLHDAEIGIEIVRIAETIPSLSEGNRGTAA